MLKFYLFVCRDKFYVYRAKDRAVETLSSGYPYLEYEQDKMRKATENLVIELLEGNNIEDKNELQFVLIENSDKVRNDTVNEVLGNSIIARYNVHDLVKQAVSKLACDPKLYIKELGVNYDGECYHLDDKGPMYRSEYSLLALSIKPEALLKFLN